MLKSIEGVYRDWKTDLLEPVPACAACRVFVTFLAQPVDLAEHGIDNEQAASLRHRLKSFDEDWGRPEMDVYDAD